MVTLASGTCAMLGFNAWAEIASLGDAINKAGRQRMLSQRMSKAWLAVMQGVEVDKARKVLTQSVALFEEQLADLRRFASSAELRETYSQVEPQWTALKAGLLNKDAKRADAVALLQQDAKVLALSNQGTLQFESTLDKPVGKLVNVSGRQRMLSQRMAKFYLVSTLLLDPSISLKEIDKARTEFLAAMQLLRSAPQTTQRIQEQLALADGQWVFFDGALQHLKNGDARPQSMADVFNTSENLLATMDRVTTLFAALEV